MRTGKTVAARRERGMSDVAPACLDNKARSTNSGLLRLFAKPLYGKGIFAPVGRKRPFV
jgi:hypothetical protein